MRRLLCLIAVAAVAAESWSPQQSGTTASLRGISALNDRIAWASGTGGTYLRTLDGGATWKQAQVPGAEKLDFRDVHPIDQQTAWLMSAGPGDQSRIYRTADGGSSWTLQFTNPDAAGFFDAIAFWDARRGLVVGDSVEGRMAVFGTGDGGANWRRIDTPPALEKEGAFAASGSCLTVGGGREAWFATTGARVFHTPDGGRSWTVAETPVRHDGPSAGIFSLTFSDGKSGVAVGGDYSKPGDDAHNVAITGDGGKTWTEPASRPGGFRSAVAYVGSLRSWIAVGTSGSDISTDGGRTWKAFDRSPYNAIGFPFVVGPKGVIARYGARK